MIRGRNAVLAVFLLVTIGCAGARRPTIEPPLLGADDRAPVVILPGITGTRLADSATGRPVWGDFRRLLFPRDGGYGLVRPLGAEPSGDLELDGPLLDLTFGPFRIDVYRGLVRTLVAQGYREGETLFLFTYDWREDSTVAANRLAADLDRLRQARGEEVLRVHLICQSDAGRIARWVIRFGAATLDEVEAGDAHALPWLAVDRLIFVGSAHGGALATFRTMHEGRRYVPFVGRRFRPEAAFTFPALFEALPGYRPRPFVDGEDERLEVDLFDPDAWRHFGWSIYAPRATRRVERSRFLDRFGDDAARDEHLAFRLDRARRIHAALRADLPGASTTTYLAVQNLYRPTPERARLVTVRGRVRPEFPKRRDVRLVSPGDGHATLESQRWLAPGELDALASTFYVDARHRKLVSHPAAWSRIVEWLADADQRGQGSHGLSAIR